MAQDESRHRLAFATEAGKRALAHRQRTVPHPGGHGNYEFADVVHAARPAQGPDVGGQHAGLPACGFGRSKLKQLAARGRQGGRKPVMTDEKLRRAQTLLAQGLTVREAAARVKVGKTPLYAAVARHDLSP